MDEEKKVTGRKNILLSGAAVLILCILLFPLYWALITSLKTEQEIFRNPPTFYPHMQRRWRQEILICSVLSETVF